MANKKTNSQKTDIQTVNTTVMTKEFLKHIQGFLKLLHKKPATVKQLPHKKNVNYIPISIIEKYLDEIFTGLWQTKNFRYQVIVNEIAGSIDLEVFQPNAGIWITRQGAASVQIRQLKATKITDINAKIKDAITMDLPHLKSACIKNAAASLGERFGRNINREYWELYQPLIPDEQKQEDISNQIKNSINGQKSKD